MEVGGIADSRCGLGDDARSDMEDAGWPGEIVMAEMKGVVGGECLRMNHLSQLF